MGDRRVWWAVGAILAALVAAMLIGAGPASADTGAAGHRPDASATASPTASATTPRHVPVQTRTATGKRRSAPAAAVAVARSIRAIESPTASPRPAVRTVAHAPGAPGPLAALVVNVLSGAGVPTPNPPAVTSVGRSLRAAAAVPSAPATPGVTGVRVGHSDLTIPCCGSGGYVAPADWYFPTQSDGSVQARGVIWLQHGFLADKAYYSALATDLAQNTNSVVVAPTLTSFPLSCTGCWLGGARMHQAAATMFIGDRAALNISANAAGYQGALPTDFVLAGHSAGGGFAASVGGYYAADPRSDGSLRGIVMYDGVSMNGTLPQALRDLGSIPIYQIAAPTQMLNLFGVTTDELVRLRPTAFTGVVLADGSHVDAMMGTNPLIDVTAQLVTRRSPPGNTAAIYTLSNGWINDFYAGAGPANPQHGLYGLPGRPLILGQAAAIVLPTPESGRPSPLELLLRSWTAAVLPVLFGERPPVAAVPAAPVRTIAA